MGSSAEGIDMGEEPWLGGMLTLREGRGDEGEGPVDWCWVMTCVRFAESSMILDDGDRARALRPVRGLGPRGVGGP